MGDSRVPGRSTAIVRLRRLNGGTGRNAIQWGGNSNCTTTQFPIVTLILLAEVLIGQE
jgi:hypothetical protein